VSYFGGNVDVTGLNSSLIHSSTTSRPRIPPPSQKIWHPNHGIVFQASPRPGVARMTSVAAAGIEQDMMFHSASEDSYVMAPLDLSAIESAIERDMEEVKPFQLREPVQLPPDPKWEVLPDQDGQKWKMTEELFQAAKHADTGTPESYWSHALYRGPINEGNKEATVKVHYCRSKLTTERVLDLTLSG
jgi:hypothetical protein